MVLNLDQFCPQVHWIMSEDVLGCHPLGVRVGCYHIWWLEAKDAIKHPTMHRRAPIWRFIWPQVSVMPRSCQCWETLIYLLLFYSLWPSLSTYIPRQQNPVLACVLFTPLSLVSRTMPGPWLVLKKSLIDKRMHSFKLCIWLFEPGTLASMLRASVASSVK